MAAPCAAPDHLTRVSGGDECLIVKTYRGAPAGDAGTLFVLLHGNHTSGSPAVSQYPVAEEIAAKAAPGAVAVALLRPGYNDDQGNYSSGWDGRRADNFGTDIIDKVADAIVRLKAFHGARRLVLVGHSGGAAMTGVMLGRQPGLADAGVLVACPCDVRAWRQGRSMPWGSASAIDYVDVTPRQTRIAVIVGDRDTVTPPGLSVAYSEALQPRGIAARLLLLPGIDHVSVIRAPEVVAEALRLERD